MQCIVVLRGGPRAAAHNKICQCRWVCVTEMTTFLYALCIPTLFRIWNNLWHARTVLLAIDMAIGDSIVTKNRCAKDKSKADVYYMGPL